MFLHGRRADYYYASYGKEGRSWKDIFRITNYRWAWGEPENLGNVINTELDRRLPVPEPRWKNAFTSAAKVMNRLAVTIFFKSVFDFNTRPVSQPENIGIPINTSDDDIFMFRFLSVTMHSMLRPLSLTSEKSVSKN